MNPFSWFAGLIGLGLEIISGSNPILMGLLGMLLLAFILFRANVSLPTAALISILAMGMMAMAFNVPINPDTGAGFFSSVWLLLLAIGGFLIFNFLYRRAAQA